MFPNFVICFFIIVIQYTDGAQTGRPRGRKRVDTESAVNLGFEKVTSSHANALTASTPTKGLEFRKSLHEVSM